MAPENDARKAGSRPAPPALRVLVVDTDGAFLTAIARVVESSRCRVDCAATAAEAVRYLKRNQYNLVIADLDMPGLRAEQLYARVEERLPEGLRLLFLAARPPRGPRQTFLEERRLTWLAKPLHLRRFLDKLDDLLLLATQPPEED